MNPNLATYINTLRGKRVAVLGIGVSNTPLILRLRKAGISVTACDKKTEAQLGALADQLRAAGAALSLGETYLDQLDHDVIFRSPGIRPDVPALTSAVEKGAVLTSEMEVFFDVCPCRIIAVTGSDGKTTTTTLIAEMLKAAGYTVHVGGNIGNPLLVESAQMQAGDIVVLELSSFQLMSMHKSPQIAVMTNLSPNHLDMHKDMDEYRAAKEAIFRYQQAGDLAIFNHDNAETLAISARAPQRCLYFSRRQALDVGVYVQDGKLICADADGARVLFAQDAILLPGAHNVENYLAAIAAVQGLVSADVMEQTARSFPGVAHRIELVRELAGVRYYNDSIASSPTRTIAGLRAFAQKLIVIAGGYDKKIPFDALGDAICMQVKTLVLNGHTAEKIRDAVIASPLYQEGAPSIIMATDFDAAVMQAQAAARVGDVVLMSPACASFDQFPNFAARGDRFKELVNKL